MTAKAKRKQDAILGFLVAYLAIIAPVAVALQLCFYDKVMGIPTGLFG